MRPAGIAILGPTGCGKSAFAMRVAAELPVEIISVDSAQVYRGLDIGTAKPSAAERAAVPHHLIDIRDPEQTYSAGEFRSDCQALLAGIAARGRIPLLVGGTMLYFRALFRGIAAMPAADPELRAQIDARAALLGWPTLHAELAMRDPESAARIHPQDSQRIQRALEVVSLSGRSLRDHWREDPRPSSFGDWRICILDPADRALLHGALAARLEAMMQAGFAQEVAALVARGASYENSPTARLVGYRQMAAYCRGVESLHKAVEKTLFATRQLAKRQLTWMHSGSLLPPDAELLHSDPFKPPTMEQMLVALIKAKSPPC